MKYALATALCLLTLAVATPALATPLAFASCADFDARYASSLELRQATAEDVDVVVALYRGEGSGPALFTAHMDMIGTPRDDGFYAGFPSGAVTLVFSRPIVAWAIDMSVLGWFSGTPRVTTNVGDVFEDRYDVARTDTFVRLLSDRPFTSLKFNSNTGKNITSFESMRFVLALDDPMPSPLIGAAPAIAADSMPEPATLILLGSGLVAVSAAIRHSRRFPRR